MIVVGKHVINRTRRKHLCRTEFSNVARVCLKTREEEVSLKGEEGNSAEMYTQVCAHSISVL